MHIRTCVSSAGVCYCHSELVLPAQLPAAVSWVPGGSPGMGGWISRRLFESEGFQHICSFSPLDEVYELCIRRPGYSLLDRTLAMCFGFDATVRWQNMQSYAIIRNHMRSCALMCTQYALICTCMQSYADAPAGVGRAV